MGFAAGGALGAGRRDGVRHHGEATAACRQGGGGPSARRGAPPLGVCHRRAAADTLRTIRGHGKLQQLAGESRVRRVWRRRRRRIAGGCRMRRCGRGGTAAATGCRSLLLLLLRILSSPSAATDAMCSGYHRKR
jgi:hypothetical protein